MAVQPRLASAIMLLREREPGPGIEVFMVRRVIQSDFMPNVYVFPGGSASKDDRAVENAKQLCMPFSAWTADPEGHTTLGSGIRAAAIRELFEEAGVLLAYHGGQMLALNEGNIPRFAEYRQALNDRQGSLVEIAEQEKLIYATDRLAYFSHWITPEGMPKRFDTYFFLATAPEEQEVAHDQLETSEGVWVQPSEALSRYEEGTFPLVFATLYQLRELAAFQSVREILDYSVLHPVKSHLPVLTQEGETSRVYLPDDPDGSWDVPEHMTRPR